MNKRQKNKVQLLSSKLNYRTSTMQKAGCYAEYAPASFFTHDVGPEPKPIVSTHKEVLLSSLTVDQLRELAKASSLKGFSKMKKADLISALA